MHYIYLTCNPLAVYCILMPAYNSHSVKPTVMYMYVVREDMLATSCYLYCI